MTADMYNMESLPVLVESLHFKAGQTVHDVACGEKHTIVVTSAWRSAVHALSPASLSGDCLLWL
jgi:hypothetical protein